MKKYKINVDELNETIYANSIDEAREEVLLNISIMEDGEK